MHEVLDLLPREHLVEVVEEQLGVREVAALGVEAGEDGAAGDGPGADEGLVGGGGGQVVLLGVAVGRVVEEAGQVDVAGGLGGRRGVVAAPRGARLARPARRRR